MPNHPTAPARARAETAPSDEPLPALSAVVVVGPLRDRAGGCVRALLTQAALARMEVLVIDLAPKAEPVPGSEHAAVRVMRLPPETTFAAARTYGVRVARGRIVAFLEEHVRVRPGWADAVIAAHDGPWAAVGGEVHNGNPGLGRSDVTSLLSYGLFSPSLATGETDLLPGQNSAYRRAVLLSYGDRLEHLLGSDLVLMRRLRLDGHRLWIEPRAAIEHLNETRLRSALRGYWLFHRCYAPLRAEEFGWSLGRRLAYVALTPVIPLYFIAHFGRFLARRHRHQLWRFIGNIGFVYLAELAGAVGQATGLLFGAGDAAQRFTHYELTEPRAERTVEVVR